MAAELADDEGIEVVSVVVNDECDVNHTCKTSVSL
jgi:dihydroxyacetone kinase